MWNFRIIYQYPLQNYAFTVDYDFIMRKQLERFHIEYLNNIYSIFQLIIPQCFKNYYCKQNIYFELSEKLNIYIVGKIIYVISKLWSIYTI